MPLRESLCLFVGLPFRHADLGLCQLTGYADLAAWNVNFNQHKLIHEIKIISSS